MSDCKASVVIPAYNGARFLREAIESVLNQTYPNFELIVVDDVSTDNTPDIVKQFDDPRVKYIRHPENRGAIAARYTGNRAATGEIVAFLDQDDLFHPDKLQTHVNFYAQHPDVGLTYNPRFELNHSAKTIRGIFKPPHVMSLADLVLGFPIAPSDMVLRQEWAIREDIWDDRFITQGEEVIVNGGEYVFLGRLFLAGCKFANVGRVLNYRRYQSGRIFSNLSLRCKSETTCQEIILSDPRCPGDVSALRPLAYANTHVMWAYCAFAQAETSLGQEFVLEAVRLDPTLLNGQPAKLTTLLLSMCIDDETIDHEARTKTVFNQLPPELNTIAAQSSWAVAAGYLLRGIRAIIWDRPADGKAHFERAATLNAEIDDYIRGNLIDQILTFEAEFGSKAAQDKLQQLLFHLKKIGGWTSTRFLNGLYFISQAFQSYHRGEYNKVPGQVIGAISNDPTHLANRGVLAITFRSILKRGIHHASLF